MEDNSYVSLSLEKYNELYDKAKKYDEITEKMTDDLKNMIDNMYKVVVRLANEESAATEEVDKEFHLGQKVKLIELGNHTNSFNIGDICTVEDLRVDDSEECIKIKNCEHGYIGYVSVDMIEKVNKGEEK